METVDPRLLKEIDEEKPDTPVGLLTDEQKDTLIERAFLGLYRWYSQRSQTKRNWNPDFDFDWRKFRTDHTEKVNNILEGFFAVEQYVPDYVFTLLRVIRKSHGRSHFHIRWGSEEEKHADLWENTLLFSRFRKPKWIEDYKHALREKEWELPWDCPIHMIFYTVVQERATQVNYLNTGLIARGKSKIEEFKNSADPVLARVSQVIAIDEAAHYNFFLEGARLYMYYYPTKAIEALHNVIKYFAMPAGDLIPGYDKFSEIVAKANIYGRREHMKDVLDVALENIGVKGRRALFKGIERIRQVPDESGNMRHTAIFDLLDYDGVESKVKRLFGRIADYEKDVGFDLINPTEFTPSGLKA